MRVGPYGAEGGRREEEEKLEGLEGQGGHSSARAHFQPCGSLLQRQGQVLSLLSPPQVGLLSLCSPFLLPRGPWRPRGSPFLFLAFLGLLVLYVLLFNHSGCRRGLLNSLLPPVSEATFPDPFPIVPTWHHAGHLVNMGRLKDGPHCVSL